VRLRCARNPVLCANSATLVGAGGRPTMLDHLSEIQFSHREQPLGATFRRAQPDGSVFAKLSSRALAIQNRTRRGRPIQGDGGDRIGRSRDHDRADARSSSPSSTQTTLSVARKKTRRDDPVASQLLKLAGPGAESALLPGPNRPSGRSQRGDSAWCKTLDHLLSLLMETSV
jgi:hypothetical protein